jgi:hypothetical protein
MVVLALKAAPCSVFRPAASGQQATYRQEELPSDVNWFTYGNAATAIFLDPISGPFRGRLVGAHNNGVQRC